MPSIASRVRTTIARLAALSTLMFASEALAQQPTDTRLAVRAVHWEVEHQGQQHTIHGLAVEGFAVDMTGKQGERIIRALMMPIGWNGEPNHTDAQLQFAIEDLDNGSSSYQVLDIELGAVMVELEPSQDRIAAIAPLIRDAALASLKRAEDTADIPVPTMRKEFGETVRAFVDQKRGMGLRERSDQEILQQAQDSEIYATFGSFWPMFITRSITAGAEGTDALLIALPAQNQPANQFVCFARYLSGTNYRMFSPNANIQSMNAGQHVRIDVTENAGQAPTLDVDPPTTQPVPIVDWAHAVLCAGWSEVFEVTNCPTPPGQGPAEPSP